MITCPVCGNLEKDNSSLYCQNCGSHLTTNGSNTIKIEPEPRRVIFQNRKPYNRRKTVASFAIIGFIFVAVVASALVIFNYNNIPFNQIGQKTYTGQFNETTQTNLTLNMNIDVGNFDIQSQEMQNTSYSIVQQVFSTDKTSNMTNAIPVIVDEKPGSIIINFVTKIVKSSYNPSYKYNFIIKLNSKIILENLYLQTDVGNINSNIVNQNILSFEANSLTGNVDSSFTNCVFEKGTANFQTKTGNVNLYLKDVTFSANRTWNISTSVGTITTTLNLQSLTATEQEFNLETSTGSITVQRSYTIIPKESVYAKVSTGSISIDGKTSNQLLYINNQKSSSSIIRYDVTANVGDITVSQF